MPLVFALFLTLSGCGNSIVDGVSAPGVSNTELIEKKEGGEVALRASDGAVVRLKIPPEALNKSTEITLRTATADEASGAGLQMLHLITIEPADLLLFETAQLFIEYPKDSIIPAESALFFLNGNSFVPLKQNRGKETKMTGYIYRFGNYFLSEYDMGRCRDMAYDIIEAEVPVDWQSLMTLFNGLVWSGNYFKDRGEKEDSMACFEQIPVICSEGIDWFLGISPPEEGPELEIYKNGLEKYKYIQKLSADQQVLLKNIDGS